MPFCLVLVVTSLARVGGVSGFVHSLPPEMKSLRVSGEFGWFYIISWTIMVSFGYNTSAMAQRYFSVDTEASAKKVALLCCVLFFAGAFLWFAPTPLCEVIVGSLQTTLTGELIDPLHEARIEWQGHVVEIVLRFDLRRDLLPIQNLIRRHAQPNSPPSSQPPGAGRDLPPPRRSCHSHRRRFRPHTSG